MCGANVNTVFQDYALFPHMTMAQNIEYGLRVRRVPRAGRRAKTGRALEMVRLPGLGGAGAVTRSARNVELGETGI